MYINKLRFSLLIFSGLLIVSSCKVSAPVQEPVAVSVPTTFTATASIDSVSIADMRWKDFFADPYLKNLIDVGLKNNLDLQIALQRIEIARAVVQASKGALLPTLDLAARAGVEKFGDYTMNGVGNYDTNLSENIQGDRRIATPTPDYFLGLCSSWEIDLWGKLRNQKKAAYLRFLASENGRLLVKTALIAQIAEAYYELLTLDNELEIIGQNVQLQEKAVELIEVQKMAGRVTQLAVQQFTAQLLNTRSLEGQVQQRIMATENRLNLLLGRFPQNITRGKPIIEHPLPEAINAGIPSEMLLRRPDIRQAELRLAAAKADTDAARAAFFPTLRLSPYIGFNAFNAAVLFNPGSVAFGILGGLSAPLLNRNVVKANYNQTIAANREIFYDYQKAIITGFSETVTNLESIETYRKVEQWKQEQVQVLRQGASTANDLFVAGFASYLEVVTAQRNVLEAELELAAIKKQQFLSLIDLYRALGGGWE